MFQTEFVTINDIPPIIYAAEKNVNPEITKIRWTSIIPNFLNSTHEVLKITPDEISSRHAAISLSRAVRLHQYPINYAQRGNSIYIYRKEPEHDLL